MAVSMGQVARHAGVSQRTVSNVVNNAPHVSPATRQKVEASLAALGYRPNVAARRLRSGRTGTITLAIPNFTSRYFADLAEAVIRHARQSGLNVLIETTDGDHDRELALLQGRHGVLTDGVIMSALAIGADDEHQPRAEYPIVLVGDRRFEGPVDHVGIPNRKAARAAVTHLIQNGRRRIGLLGRLDDPLYSYVLRLDGYKRALADAHIPFDDSLLISSRWELNAAEAAMDELLASGTELPDGLFAMNDSAALGALRSLVRHGIRVPEQIALVGFDNVVEASYSTPSLSSIAPSLDEIASNALELLSDQLTAAPGERVPERRHVSFELIVRESSAPATLSAPAVDSAP